MKLTRNVKLGLIAFAVLNVLLVVIFVSFYIPRAGPEQASAIRELGVIIYPEPKPIEHFRLLDQRGEPFTPTRLMGQWSLVFFGFTACPDICPLTMGELKQFYEKLEGTNSPHLPQVVLVTTDPDRDDPESMSNYVGNFHEDFLGLSGDATMLSALAAQLYVAYKRTEAPGQDNHPAGEMAANDYLIEHSWHISIINPRAELYAVIQPPHRDGDLVSAFQILTND